MTIWKLGLVLLTTTLTFCQVIILLYTMSQAHKVIYASLKSISGQHSASFHMVIENVADIYFFQNGHFWNGVCSFCCLWNFSKSLFPLVSNKVHQKQNLFPEGFASDYLWPSFGMVRSVCAISNAFSCDAIWVRNRLWAENDSQDRFKWIQANLLKDNSGTRLFLSKISIF